MARRQSRRTVSLNREIYEAAKKLAARRNLTLAAFVETSLIAAGVPAVAHPQQSLAIVRASQKAARAAARHRMQQLPSRERQLLGDGVANAHGFR